MKKREIDTTPFDTKRIPPKQNLFFMPFIWLLCWITTKRNGLKIKKVNMEGLKPPFLVLGTHHSFTDFYVTPLALMPYRANYVSELEGFEAFGETLYRQVGCLGTRKFINDIDLVRNIKRCMDRKGILVLYPEARYANVGTVSKLPISVGKLVKMLKVPVVVLNMKGNYLLSPIWNLEKRKNVKLSATMTQVLTKEQIMHSSPEDLLKVVEEHLYYDEYAYQEEQGIKITNKNRAKGLHLPLYQCPICKTEFAMDSQGTKLFCKACESQWEKDEFSRLCFEKISNFENNKFSKHLDKTLDKQSEDNQLDNDHVYAAQAQDLQLPVHKKEDGTSYYKITEWYEWQREQVQQEIDEGKYLLDCKVQIEALPNAVNFIDLGEGRLVHKQDGFYLTFRDYGEKEDKTMFFSSKNMVSIHTEYDYRGKGQCVTLSTTTNTYFLFPRSEGFNATKIQFATEYLS